MEPYSTNDFRYYNSLQHNDQTKKKSDKDKAIDEHIAKMKKLVDGYINANKDKLTEEQIKKLHSDLKKQIDIANAKRD